MVKKKHTKAEKKRATAYNNRDARKAAQQCATSRNMRKAIAEDTLAILGQGWYNNGQSDIVSISQQQQWAVSNTILYSPNTNHHEVDLLPASLDQNANHYEPTAVEVNDLTTLDAARKLACSGLSILCLNFASGRNPGGGFLNGSQAQEESIARASGLYPCLIQESVQDYYKSNRTAKAPYYTDHMIYTPNVPVFKNEDGSLMEKPILVSFVTAPAVNVSETKKKNGGELDSSMAERTMRRRIGKVFQIAQKHEHDCLVLGAWGCGVFGNDPADVARWFHEELRIGKCHFQKIIFAIYSPSDDRFLRAFLLEFNKCEYSKISARRSSHDA